MTGKTYNFTAFKKIGCQNVSSINFDLILVYREHALGCHICLGTVKLGINELSGTNKMFVITAIRNNHDKLSGNLSFESKVWQYLLRYKS
jgi:hypothetical protein